MIATFLPLAGLPLIALATLTYFFVTRAVDQEIRRRSGPELAAFSRNLETVERRLERQLVQLARDPKLRRTMGHARGTALEQVGVSWLLGSNFDGATIYGRDGNPLAMVVRTDKAKVLDAWSSLFANRKATAVTDTDRNPSSDPTGAPTPWNGSRFVVDSPERLTAPFRAFLESESGWITREAVAKDGVLRVLLYRTLLNEQFRPVGFVEGKLEIDAAKLGVLAESQGLDLAFVSNSLAPLVASSPETAQKLSGAFSSARGAGRTPKDLRGWSFEVAIDERPVEFFFAPLSQGSEGGKPVAWIAAGLSKADQIALRNRILLWVGALAAFMIVTVVSLTLVFSKWITRPVSELVRAVEAMRAGEWVEPVEATSKTEMGYLVRRFNDMALSVQVTKRTLETKLDELAQAHGELTQTQNQLVQSAKMSSLGQLVAGVAHELNNPIAFIYSNMAQMRGYVQSLEKLAAEIDRLRPTLSPKELAELDATLETIEWDYMRGDLADIVRSCLEGSVRVKDIVLGLRNFSRTDRGQTSEADLHEALRATVKLLSSQMRDRARVEWRLGDDGRAVCNLSQINQVFMNLIANAVQALDEKGTVRISTHVDAATDELVISVRDDGKGIAPENLQRIFDPFFTTKKVGDGTGLGLSIVYGILERHGGRIEAKSETRPGHPERGTEFIVHLPRKGLPSDRSGSESAA